MSYAADLNSSRLAVRRVESVKVDDSGEMQRMTALGYDDETFKEVHRVQPFGLSSHPPKGSHGLALLGNGRPDQTVLLGVEHPEKRPRDIPEGATRLYDAADGFVYLDADGNLFAEVTKGANVKAGETITIEAPTIYLKGNIVHDGNMSTSGVHVDANGPHTA